MNKRQVELVLTNIRKFYQEWDYESFLVFLRRYKYLKETDFSSFNFKSPDHFLSSLQDNYDEDIHWNKYGLINPAKRISQREHTFYDIEGSKTFITNNDLIEGVEDLCTKLPKLKGVVGIPRSGLLPASLVSNYLSIPLYSLTNDSIVKLYCRSDNGGGRMHNYIHDESLPLLVLDDTCFSGREIARVKNILGENNILYACVFTTNPGKTNLDFYSKTLSYPHILEWNLFDAEPLKNGVMDMDGVLCNEVPLEVCDDEDKYIDYITSVEPIMKHIPRLFGCRAICTGRLEKYRGVTEKWLDRHGVKYQQLIMYQGTREERDRNHIVNVAKYKAESYKKLEGSKFFIESCDRQSVYISNILKADQVPCYVICPTTKKVY